MKAFQLSQLWAVFGKHLTEQQDVIVSSVVTDSRAVTKDCVFVALVGERFDGHDFVEQAVQQGAEAVVISRDCDCGVLPNDRILRVTDTVQAYLDMAGFYRKLFALPVVAVTGSVGKTTTKDMIAAVLAEKLVTVKTQANLNNEIGLPATLFRLEQESQALVVEMGMQGLGEISQLAHAATPTMGVITNIGVSHMEKLGSRENICKAKMELAEVLTGKPLLLNGDDSMLQKQRPTDVKTIFYGRGENCQIRADNVSTANGETQLTICHTEDWWNDGAVRIEAVLPCVGEHNVGNALAAYGVGRLAGLTAPQCVAGLAEYQPSGMRQKMVAWHGCTVVEDCYNASPDSVRAAMTTLAQYPCTGKRIAVLGDMLELGALSRQGHLDMGALAAETSDLLLCYGECAKDYVKGANDSSKAFHFDQKSALTAFLRTHAVEGSVIWVKGSRGMKLEEILEELYGEGA